MQAFEMTGTVDETGHLAPDQPLPVPPDGRVRMIVLLEDRHCPGTYHYPLAIRSDLSPLQTLETISEDPEIQQIWHGLAEVFVGDPDEDWTQLLHNARRKSQWT